MTATGVTLCNPPAVVHSLEEYKKEVTAFHTPFPDLRFTGEEVVAVRD